MSYVWVGGGQPSNHCAGGPFREEDFYKRRIDCYQLKLLYNCQVFDKQEIIPVRQSDADVPPL